MQLPNPLRLVRFFLLLFIGVMDSRMYWLSWRGPLRKFSDQRREGTASLFKMACARAKNYRRARALKLEELARASEGRNPPLRSPYSRTNIADMTADAISIPARG